MRRAGRYAALALAGVAGCHPAPRPAPIRPLPAAAYSHYLAGKYALYHDDAAAAIPELEAATQAAPHEAMIAVELALAFAKAKRPQDARRVLAAARRTWPRHSHVWLASGDIAEHADRAEAARAYRRAIELEPTDEHGYLGLARVELADGDAAGAETTLQRLVTKIPESVDGHYRLAQRLAANGKREAATDELRAVLERDPDHLDARVDLSRLLRQLGKMSEAVAQLRSAFDRAGQPMDLAEELYWLICEADDRQGAIDLLTLLDDDRSDADALATVATFDRGLGRLAEARAVAEHIRTLDADASTIALAQVDAADGRVQAALDALLAIPASSTRYLQARGVASGIALAAKRPLDALAIVEPLRAAHPDDAAMRMSAAMAYAAAGDATTARQLARALPPVPHARVLDALGDSAGALAVLEPALRAKSDNASALNLAGFLLARRRERLADAERYLARARDLAPGEPAILDSWGYLRVQQGKTREAVKVLDRAARFSPGEPEIRLHLAAAWAADGAPRHAEGILDRAIGEDPSLCSSYDADMKRTGVFALLLVAACSKGPSEGQCKQLLDHLVDLEFKKAGAAASSDQMKAEIAKQKTSVTEAKSKEFLDTCTKKMSKSRVECALKATELDGDGGVAKCDEAK